MHGKIGKVILYSFAPLILLAGAVALGDGSEGVRLNVTNDGTEDIVVTVYDNSVRPKAVVLPHARINGFTTIPISVSPDASGRANVSWTAISADSSAHKCGHAEHVGLGDSASLNVHADSDCGAGT